MNQPSVFSQFVFRLRRLFGSPPAAPKQSDQNQPQSMGITPPPVTRKVSLIIYNPTIPSRGGRKLNEVMGWNDPDQLVEAMISDLREVSHGYADYQLAERIEINEFPLMIDNFRYTPDSYLHCWQTRSGFHQPDAVNYHLLLERSDILNKINAGIIDEVWMVFFPYGGLYESRMAGPGAFWCNAPPLDGTQTANRRFVIMCYNYERGVGEMLESYGHRAESILAQAFIGTIEKNNLWKQYTLYDKIAPGRAEVGNIHFAPNSQQDYDWGNLNMVPSRCRNWVNFPELSGKPVLVNCREWGNGDIRAHHRWWFNLLPHVEGKTGYITNNWWEFIVDPNRVP